MYKLPLPLPLEYRGKIFLVLTPLTKCLRLTKKLEILTELRLSFFQTRSLECCRRVSGKMFTAAKKAIPRSLLDGGYDSDYSGSLKVNSPRDTLRSRSQAELRKARAKNFQKRPRSAFAACAV